MKKSKLLLPSIEEELGEEDDPRAELIRRLQEYERYKKASFNLDALPRIDRDFYILNKVPYETVKKDEAYQNIDLDKLVIIFHKLMEQTKFLTPHDVKKDFLSVREKMTLILNILKKIMSKQLIPQIGQRPEVQCMYEEEYLFICKIIQTSSLLEA